VLALVTVGSRSPIWTLIKGAALPTQQMRIP